MVVYKRLCGLRGNDSLKMIMNVFLTLHASDFEPDNDTSDSTQCLVMCEVD